MNTDEIVLRIAEDLESRISSGNAIRLYNKLSGVTFLDSKGVIHYIRGIYGHQIIHAVLSLLGVRF